jgi:Calx-beta domain-containing protein/calcineurin-like phosphoesterase family protein
MRLRVAVAVLGVAVIAVAVASAARQGEPSTLLKIADAGALERDGGARTVAFSVRISRAPNGRASVDYATSGGTASSRRDYVPRAGSLTFGRGATTRTVSIRVTGDTADELDETFRISLSNASGATIADAVAVGTIRDDDGPPLEGIRVAAAGDIACDPGSNAFAGGRGEGLECRQRATSKLLVRGRYSAVLALGDLQYEDATQAKFAASYDLSWGRVKSTTRPVPGNHEYRTDDAEGYFRYFGAAAGDPAQGYYSYDLGGWHVVALNSSCSEVGGCSAGSPQERWLRADLAANPASCTLAYWHHPRFSSGPHGSDSNYEGFWRALYEANADVVLVGHDHDYERFAPQTASGALALVRGIREFVVGTGGKGLRPFSTSRPNSEARTATSLGILELTLGQGGYAWRFRAAVGSFHDRGSAACH